MDCLEAVDVSCLHQRKTMQITCTPRAAETLSVKAASVPWSTTAMSWVWEGEMSSITGERSGFFAQRATASNGMAFYVDTTDQAEAFNEVSNSTALAAAGTVSRSYLTPIKAGLRMTTSEIQSVVDGAAGTNNTGNPGIYSSFRIASNNLLTSPRISSRSSAICAYL